MARPCITPHCPHLATPGTPRCPHHQQQREQARGTRQQRGYDARYEAARAALHLERQPPCHWCGAPATTADHDPPMAMAQAGEHYHADHSQPMGRVGIHYHLVPACAPCNYGHRSAQQ